MALIFKSTPLSTYRGVQSQQIRKVFPLNIEIVCSSDVSGVVVQALMSLFEFETVEQMDLGGGETLTIMQLVTVKIPYPDLTDCITEEIE